MLNCLSLNPYYRVTAYDSLKNCKVFDSVRSEKKENIIDFIAHAINATKRPNAKQKRSRLNRQNKTMSTIIGLNLQTTGIAPIELDIDTTDAFDYENVENAKFTVDDLKMLLINEIKHYNYQQRLRSSARVN